ncbi:immunoglobulin superfamily member 8 isoform X2 [Rhincodon typus]|uniref:immunoglobulin superfamily member 8 isoform X2 n=1 Tax=Rhincodon typus TaxID=259920 RepID=UPI00202EAA3A|nr:immunoglobulin superfamily member 8 isoform X2 [Rhincodon typus]
MASLQRDGKIKTTLRTDGTLSFRIVKVPKGPLYRVEGTHISILCNVTNSQGAGRFDFWWSFVRMLDTSTPVAMVSTLEAEYTDATYEPRVKAKEIYIERQSLRWARLHITHLRRDDEGLYECRVDNGAKTWHPSQRATVELKVLPDTLMLSTPLGEFSSLALREGDGLSLRCRAAALTVLHTHISLAFEVTRSMTGTRDTIVGVRPDLSVESPPAGPYWSRFYRGQLGMQKVKGDTYILRMDHVKPQDAGLYHCTAAEWIQDPDGSWQKILEKRIGLENLTVQPNDLRLGVVASLAPVKFYQGDTVQLHCNVTLAIGHSEDKEEEEVEPQLAVGWWGEAKEPLALVDRRGILLPTAWHGHTPSGSELSPDRPTPLCFRLHIHRATKGDQGRYRCQVTSWGQRRGTTPYLLATAQSEPVTLFLYLSPSDTLVIPLSVGAALSLSVAVAIITAVTCCFLRRLAKR